MSLKELISNDSSPKMKLICQAIKCESSATHSTTLNFTMQPSNTYLYPPVCLSPQGSAGLCTGLIAWTMNGPVPVWTGDLKFLVFFKF